MLPALASAATSPGDPPAPAGRMRCCRALRAGL